MPEETVDLNEPIENGNGRRGAQFPVTTRPLFYGESYRFHRVPDRRAVVREDTGEPLAVVSDQYTLVEHGRLLEAVDSALTDLNLTDAPRGVYLDRNGARLRALYKFPSLARPVLLDDPICPCVKLQNSYDRSLRAAVHIGAFRFVCTNLAVGGGGLFAGGFVTLHRGEIPVENVTEQLATFLSDFDEITQLYHYWADTPLDWNRLAAILEPLPKHAREGIRNRIEPPFGTTVYDGYNAATWYATHEMSSYRSAFRLLKQINRGFQNQFPLPDPGGESQKAKDGDVLGSFFVGAYHPGGWLRAARLSRPIIYREEIRWRIPTKRSSKWSANSSGGRTRPTPRPFRPAPLRLMNRCATSRSGSSTRSTCSG